MNHGIYGMRTESSQWYSIYLYPFVHPELDDLQGITAVFPLTNTCSWGALSQRTAHDVQRFGWPSGPTLDYALHVDIHGVFL